MTDQADPLNGQELQMLNTLLAQVYPLAKAGDQAAIDRVIKILTLKRQLKHDKRIEAIE